jgi:D-aminopeptidase
MARARLRDLGITIGTYPTGLHNAITDVPGVWVGYRTLIYDEPRIARTGVTMIVPREGDIWHDHAFAGFHSFNGNGEMTGIHWIAESGVLSSPIALTNTGQVGTVHEALTAYGHEQNHTQSWSLPVVAETYDGWLNDMYAFHVKREHVYEALAAAKPGPVAEGCVGGGAGMICHDFKGGTGTSSRVIETPSGKFTLGVLVQANHGDRELFRVDGVPVGREIDHRQVPLPWGRQPPLGSIIIVVATDAPLLPGQCRRLAQRAAVGMARVGGVGHNGSGDLFLAFATGNHLPGKTESPIALQMLPPHHLNNFFEAEAEAAEEAILNAITAAETTSGIEGHTAYALPLEVLQEIMRKYRV